MKKITVTIGPSFMPVTYPYFIFVTSVIVVVDIYFGSPKNYYGVRRALGSTQWVTITFSVFFFFELTNILLICTSSGQELCRLLYCALYIFPSSTQMPDRLICFGLCSAMVAFSCIILHQNYTHCFFKVKRFC